MRCDICGIESPDAVLDSRSGDARAGHSGLSRRTKFVPFWICPACTKERERTVRLAWWIAGIASAVVGIIVITYVFLRFSGRIPPPNANLSAVERGDSSKRWSE